MPRYFLEVCYNGARYSGFQVQDNANSIQAEVEKALNIFFKKHETPVQLTGSSRTDAGVHALQNYFHFDAGFEITPRNLYNLNALLPADIALTNIYPVTDDAHSRFDAVSREYKYYIYQEKSPFLNDRAYYYPYKPCIHKLNEVAALILGMHDFTSFSKRNTQVHTFICNIEQSQWVQEGGSLVYNVKGNRFLRGMVRGLVGTMLKVTRKDNYLENFNAILASKDCSNANFAVPAHGLFLVRVNYPEGYLDKAPGTPQTL